MTKNEIMERAKEQYGTDNFNDYYWFIKVNTTLTEKEAKELAIYCWNRNIHKYDVLEIAR